LKVTTKIRAEELAAKLNHSLERGEPWQWCLGRTHPGERTFGQLLDEFLEKGSRWGPRTRVRNAATVNALRREFGDLPLSRLTSAKIEGYLARRRAGGLSAASSNRYLCVMKASLAKAHEWAYLPASPAAAVRCLREDKKAPRPYLPEEIERLLAVLEPRHADVLRVYLETGLRLSELASLRWADVDLGARALTVRGTKAGRDRTIPLSGTVAAILERLRRERAADPVVGIEPLVFGTKADIRQVLRRAYNRAQIPADRQQWLRPIHSLRDSYITRLVEAGVPIDRVRLLAGHADVSMTLRYAATREASLFEAVQKVFG